MITEDKKATKICKLFSIQFTTIINIIIALKGKNIINLQNAKELLNDLQKYGWYSKEIILKAQGDLNA